MNRFGSDPRPAILHACGFARLPRKLRETASDSPPAYHTPTRLFPADFYASERMIPSASAAVRFEEVTKVYSAGPFRAGVRALDGVSLSINRGEVFGLVGPNRAGKTTLVKILLSICRPTSGQIMRLSRHWKDRSTLARVGYVHESQAFPRYLSARSLLEFYGALSLRPASVVRRRAGELLERFGLADRSREPIARFSKGMLQRLALCQALINDPELLVLDEPSEGMDLSARRVFDEIITERKNQGHTAILVSHHLNDIQRLCDRVAVIRSGKVAFAGRVTELVGAGAEPCGQ